LANGARWLDIHDDPKLHVDQIVIGIGEEGRSPHRTCPLCSGIGWRHKFRRDLAGRTECRVIECGQIFLYGPDRSFRIAIAVPVLARDRPLLVCVRHDQTRINRKPFTADKSGRNTSLNNTFEHPTKHDRS